jgi:hypothetical protein
METERFGLGNIFLAETLESMLRESLGLDTGAEISATDIPLREAGGKCFALGTLGSFLVGFLTKDEESMVAASV